MEIQLGLFEAILDLLFLRPMFFAGLIFVGASLYWFLRKDNTVPKIKAVIGSILMYYFLGILLRNVVGIPTLNEFFRLTRLGESIFNPNANLIPIVGEIDLEFILNILAFIPLGFLCPIISRSYEQVKRVALLGVGLSLAIEISQLFTLHRATDINDVIANTLGAVVGFLCFRLCIVIFRVKGKHNDSLKVNSMRFLPALIVATAFIFTFIS
ncbi:MAG: VanZ family protein [Oscillospiraceae bacterium]|nr:VanZ family protein [Oscillospiraceae bacterium]